MRVNASDTRGYSFQITAKESSMPARSVLEGCRLHSDGLYRPKVYDSVPSYIVKDAEYFGAVAPRTVSHLGEPQRILNELGLTLDVISFEIVPKETLTAPVEVNVDDYNMITIGLPQMFAPFSAAESVVRGIAGSFNASTGVFYGMIEIGESDADS